MHPTEFWNHGIKDYAFLPEAKGRPVIRQGVFWRLSSGPLALGIDAFFLRLR